VRVSGFGVSQGNNPAVAERLAKQLEILYADYEVDEDGYETGGVLECVLDLDRTSEAVQVIVALVDWQGTLAKTVGGASVCEVGGARLSQSRLRSYVDRSSTPADRVSVGPERGVCEVGCSGCGESESSLRVCV